MVERFGGTRVHFPLPENMTAENPLACAIGVEAARSLCNLWPQERRSIPRAAQILRNERDRALLRDADDVSVPQLARKFELTERQVYYILARGLPAESDDAPLAAPAQKQLF